MSVTATYARLAYANDPEKELKERKYTIDATISEDFTWSTIALPADPSRPVLWLLRGSKNNTTDRDFDRAINVGKVLDSHRWKEAEKQFQQLVRKYPHRLIQAVGHSGGGTVAMYAARIYPSKVHAEAFAPGFTMIGLKEWNRLPKPRTIPRIMTHLNPHDHLSIPAAFCVYTHPSFFKTKKGEHPHSPKNFE